MEKRRNCSLGANSPLFHSIFCLLLDVHVSAGTGLSLRDKRLFEISEFEITRVNCILKILPQKKKRKFSDKKSDIFHISAQNIDFGYSLEPPRRFEQK